MMKLCAWCDNLFEPTTKSQIYCGPECRKEATRQRVLAQYKQNRHRRKRKKLCVGGCGTILSVYNESEYCTICMMNPKEFKQVVKQIKDTINGKIP